MMQKNIMKPINNNKNKLNSKIILSFQPYSNQHIKSLKSSSPLQKLNQTGTKFNKTTLT